MSSIIKTKNNLLKDKNFQSTLQLEANFTNQLRGGHFPYYLTKTNSGRLVANINLLNNYELEILNLSNFTTNN